MDVVVINGRRQRAAPRASPLVGVCAKAWGIRSHDDKDVRRGGGLGIGDPSGFQMDHVTTIRNGHRVSCFSYKSDAPELGWRYDDLRTRDQTEAVLDERLYWNRSTIADSITAAGALSSLAKCVLWLIIPIDPCHRQCHVADGLGS